MLFTVLKNGIFLVYRTKCHGPHSDCIAAIQTVYFASFVPLWNVNVVCKKLCFSLSFSCLLVLLLSGAAAIKFSKNPNMTREELEEALLNDATQNIVVSAKDNTPNRLLYVQSDQD